MERILDSIPKAERMALQQFTRQQWSVRIGRKFAPMHQCLTELPVGLETPFSVEAGVVKAGAWLSENHPGREDLLRTIVALGPWRKGPFNLCGIKVDGEWRSDWKWERIQPRVCDLQGCRVLDLGCNNGYSLFRMLEHGASHVVGVDPAIRPWCQLDFIRHFVTPNLSLEFHPWGFQQVGLLHEFFQKVFCMGILYHHSHPVEILNSMRRALQPGGQLIVETIVLPGNDANFLLPEGRYARMQNVWFLPTLRGLEVLLKRAGFVDISVWEVHLHGPEEQRSTAFCPGPSFRDFLHAEHPEALTEEGLPRPLRATVSAKRAERVSRCRTG